MWKKNSFGLHPTGDGLHPSSDGLQSNSEESGRWNEGGKVQVKVRDKETNEK